MKRSRPFRHFLAALALAASSISVAAIANAPAAQASTPTAPSSETARSLYMNNWLDTTGIWMDPQLAQTDANTQYGRRLAELHYSPSGAPPLREHAHADIKHGDVWSGAVAASRLYGRSMVGLEQLRSFHGFGR